MINDIKWKFTNATNNKLLAALFDLSGNNLALRTPFNHRSWVTRRWKIFKKVLVCVFLADKSNQATFLENINFSSVKTARKTGYFSFFTWSTTWLIVATNFFFDHMIGFHPRNSYLCVFLLYHVLFQTYRGKTLKSRISRCRRLWSQINFILKFFDLVG